MGTQWCRRSALARARRAARCRARCSDPAQDGTDSPSRDGAAGDVLHRGADTRGANSFGAAHASGSFVLLELQADAMQQVLPWVSPEVAVDALTARDLQDHERAVLRRFHRACAAADAEHPFVEHFWGGVPQRRDGGARLSITIGPHLGNRIGQVHGGILLGLAAHTACAAVPSTMRLSNIAAWFTSPGQGARLTVRSTALHASRNLAVVRTQVTGPGNVRVLEATSQHVRMPDAAQVGRTP